MIINLKGVVKGILIISLIFFIILNLNLVQAENLGTYPEAIIKYDTNSKNFIVMPYDSNTNISFVEKCMDKRCKRKIESYTLFDENNNKLILNMNHFKSSNQNSIEILSLKYNDNEMKISSNRFIIKDSTNYLNQNLDLGKTRVYLSYNKKTNKTTIRINENGKQSTKTQKDLILDEIIVFNDNFYYYRLINISKDNNNFIKVNWKQIGCNWRPSNKDRGCQEFGGTFHNGVCSNGDAILGFYFDGNKCINVSGFGVKGNFNLFMTSKECEEKCLPKPKPEKIDCNWRPNIIGMIPGCIVVDRGLYFDGKECRHIHSCQNISNMPNDKRLLWEEECEKCKSFNNKNSNFTIKDGIKYSISTDKSIYKVGENLKILYRVENLKNESINLGGVYSNYNGWCSFKIIKNAEIKWKYSHYPYLSTTEPEPFNLSPSEAKEFNIGWVMTERGDYDIIGELDLVPFGDSSSENLFIKGKRIPLSLKVWVL